MFTSRPFSKFRSAVLPGLLLCAGFAMAQDRPPQHDMSEMRHEMPSDMQQKMEQHIKQLHDKLHLSDAQEGPWQNFIAAMKPEMPAPMPDHDAMQAMTAPQRMEKMLAMMQMHQDKMRDRLTVLKTFYAQLSPEQQKIMDDHARHMMHEHMMIRMQQDMPAHAKPAQ